MSGGRDGDVKQKSTEIYDANAEKWEYIEDLEIGSRYGGEYMVW